MRYTITSPKGKVLGHAEGDNAKDALTAYCDKHPDDDTGFANGGLMTDADTHGREWASVFTLGGRITATAAPTS